MYCRGINNPKAVILALLLVVPVVASANDNDDLFGLPLEHLLEIKVQVSNRNLTTIDEAPSSVSVYSRDELQSLGVRTLDQLLNFVPGFSVSRSDTDGRTNAPVVRGRRSNSVGREILVLLDGIRLNDPVSGGVFAQERDLSLFNVKKVEVIRGPGSSLYGANAFSGVINIITDSDDSLLKLRGGEFDAREASAMVSGSGENWNISAAFANYDDEGDDYEAFYNFFGVEEDTQDPENASDIFFKARLYSASLVARHSERIGYDFINGGAQANGTQRYRVENQSLRLENKTAISFVDTTWFAEFSENESDSLLGLFPENPAPPQAGNPFYWSDGSTVEMIGGNIRTVKQQRFGLDARFDAGRNHTINLGALYRKESVGLNPFQSNIDPEVLRTTNNIVPTPSDAFIQPGFYIGGVRFDLLEASDRESYGLYVQDTWRLDKGISLTSGLRYDRYQDFGSNFSFRAGLVKEWDEDTSFKLLYGDAFRAPSFLETRAGIATGGISNPNLKPEKVQTYELAWVETLSHINSVVTLFFNEYSDLVEPVLVSDVVPGFTARQPQNKGEAETSGLEWELSSKLTNSLRMRGGLTHLFKTIEGEPVSDNLLFAIGSYQSGNTSLSISTYYHDEVLSRAQTGQTLDAYWVANLSVAQKMTRHVSLTLDIQNIGDHRFYTWSPQAGLETGLPSRGRQVMLGIEISGF